MITDFVSGGSGAAGSRLSLRLSRREGGRGPGASGPGPARGPGPGPSGWAAVTVIVSDRRRRRVVACGLSRVGPGARGHGTVWSHALQIYGSWMVKPYGCRGPSCRRLAESPGALALSWPTGSRRRGRGGCQIGLMAEPVQYVRCLVYKIDLDRKVK